MTSGTDFLFLCATCGAHTAAREAGPRCACGGLFEPRVYRDKASEASSNPQRPGAATPSEIPEVRELGRYTTPLLRRSLGGSEVFVKYEAVLPTGSYKDRGARALIGACRALGIPRVVEDSSGNAGAAIAAYAAAAGIEAEIFVQENAAPAKVRQIAAYGALATTVSGSREDVARAAREAAAGDVAAREAAARYGARRDATGRGAAGAAAPYYASHVYNPLFLAGVQSAADEIVDEIGLPEVVYLPVGNGALILGLAEGFRRRGGLPRFVAVQATAVSPIYDAWRRTHPGPDGAHPAPHGARPAPHGARPAPEAPRSDREIPAALAQNAAAAAPTPPAAPAAPTTSAASTRPPGSADPTAPAPSPTIADGVAVAAPARLQEIVDVVDESGGAVVTVSDDEIRAAQRVLAETGLYAEPTGALAAAGYLAHAEERRRAADPEGDAWIATDTRGDTPATSAPTTAAPTAGTPAGARHAPGETAVVFLTGSGLKEQS